MTRRVFVLVHTERPAACEVALRLCRSLTDQGIVLRLLADEAAALGMGMSDSGEADIEFADPVPGAAAGCELMAVVGGDGTILRGAEIARDSLTPLLGINLGHVGFLAEAEQEDLDLVIKTIVGREYTIEDRLTIEVSLFHGKQQVASTWALNEASVEKAARERMLEVVVEVDGRPLSRWGADGVVCATPTGSTAYNFSAGGPVVWPGVQALLVVPLSAHALFARPMVVAPESVVAVEVLADNLGSGVLWCDGRRTYDLPPGARVEVRKGTAPVRLARVHEAPFTDRLVRKFSLPVDGWRGAAARRRQAEA